MKQYKNVTEIAEDLYAMLSYFKNDPSGIFDNEANLIELVRHLLNVKENKTCLRCGEKFKQRHPEDKHCQDCTIELAVYGEEDGSDA